MRTSRRRSPLRIGLQLPQWGEAARREPLLRIAREAEKAGIDSLWASDHIVHPLTGHADYPYASGGLPFRAEDGYLEALTTLSVVAGATQRVRLGTSVLLLPMRETLLTAKVLATLDVLSGGRLSVVVAAGWWRSEYEALGADFDTRGDRLDEQLLALKSLWSSGEGAWNSRHVTFPPVALRPTPLQKGGPELWIGGRGPRVWRRVARTPKAGWHGIGFGAEALAEARAEIARACAITERNPDNVAYSTATGLPVDREKLLDRLLELARSDLTQVVLIPRNVALTSILNSIADLRDWVIPRFRDAGTAT